MLSLEGSQLLLAWLPTAVRHRGNVAALFGNSVQVFLASGSPVFPTKHLGYFRGWVCQVHAMLLPPVEVSCSVWGENFTSLKYSCWDLRQASKAAVNISYEVWELGLLLRLSRPPDIAFSTSSIQESAVTFLTLTLNLYMPGKKKKGSFFPWHSCVSHPHYNILLWENSCAWEREKWIWSDFTWSNSGKTSASSYSHA